MMAFQKYDDESNNEMESPDSNQITEPENGMCGKTEISPCEELKIENDQLKKTILSLNEEIKRKDDEHKKVVTKLESNNNALHLKVNGLRKLLEKKDENLLKLGRVSGENTKLEDDNEREVAKPFNSRSSSADASVFSQTFKPSTSSQPSMVTQVTGAKGGTVRFDNQIHDRDVFSENSSLEFPVEGSLEISNNAERASLTTPLFIQTQQDRTYQQRSFQSVPESVNKEFADLSPGWSRESPSVDTGSNGQSLSTFPRQDSPRNSGRSRQDSDESDDDANEQCGHYQRRCHVKFTCCDNYWPCHYCHNNESRCGQKKLKSTHTKFIKCTKCGKEQEFPQTSQFCVNCNTKFSQYFCPICKHLTEADDKPYHCEKCGICRIHKHRSFHCDVCGVCLDVQLRDNHRCRAGSAHDKCCICLEDSFTGCQILPCFHKVHKECAIQNILKGNTRCPDCGEKLCPMQEECPVPPPPKH